MNVRRKSDNKTDKGPNFSDISELISTMSGSNLLPLGSSSRFGGGGAGGSSLLNPSYMNPGAVVPHGSELNDRKRPAERESRFDKKESREERLKILKEISVCKYFSSGRRRESLGGLMNHPRPSSQVYPP